MKRVEAEIMIQASPDKVWALLAAGPDWGAWNPFILKVEGELREGARLRNTLQMAGGKPMLFKPVVLKAEAGVELRWLGRLFLPGLFDGEHAFTLQAVDGGTRLVQSERFRGLLVGLLNTDALKKSFEAFNAGLKGKVEQR